MTHATIHIVAVDYATRTQPAPHTQWVVNAANDDRPVIPTFRCYSEADAREHLARFVPGVEPEVIDRR